MLSLEVLKAVALIKDIRYGISLSESRRAHLLTDTERRKLLDCFRSAGLVRLKDPAGDVRLPGSYELCYPLHEISLCDIMVATGGGIAFSMEDTDSIYARYGMAGGRLGVLNQMACRYLSEIRLTDLLTIEPKKTHQ
ncbi:hypothetical protein [uncultured Bacteroides sp.]|uniref:hypothetical protein n=1 Tax=uncultured Bacteroides sp. TaxID=162156 RepID=UPI002AA6BE9E|nr:hypothetical protein [uncultured Bacteroides sp.]